MKPNISGHPYSDTHKKTPLGCFPLDFLRSMKGASGAGPRPTQPPHGPTSRRPKPAAEPHHCNGKPRHSDSPGSRLDVDRFKGKWCDESPKHSSRRLANHIAAAPKVLQYTIHTQKPTWNLRASHPSFKEVSLACPLLEFHPPMTCLHHIENGTLVGFEANDKDSKMLLS